MHGELQATQQALSAARAEAAEAQGALRRAESRCAALDGERRSRALEVSRLSSELGAMGARLQASAQEVRSTDQLMGALQAQRAGGERELTRLKEHGARRDDLNGQLKSALARESERVAKAWEQREKLRVTVGERDRQLAALQAELFHARADLASSAEQIAQLQEQRRLGEVREDLTWLAHALHMHVLLTHTRHHPRMARRGPCVARACRGRSTAACVCQCIMSCFRAAVRV